MGIRDCVNGRDSGGMGRVGELNESKKLQRPGLPLGRPSVKPASARCDVFSRVSISVEGEGIARSVKRHELQIPCDFLFSRTCVPFSFVHSP